LRYEYLHKAMAGFNAQKIAVGHNQDDNAETVLLNLFRGAGLKGLCGIPPVNGGIIRPLLEVGREEIEAYAKKHALRYVQDVSNASLDFNRNVLRNKILPEINKYFGAHTPSTIARNAIQLREDEEYLASAAKKEYEDSLVIARNETAKQSKACTGAGLLRCRFAHTARNDGAGGNGEEHLSIKTLTTLHPAIARRVLRLAISNLRGVSALEDIQANHIQAIMDLTQSQSGREIHLPGFHARREYDSLILYKPTENSPDTHQGFRYLLQPNIPQFICEINKYVILSTQKPAPQHCTEAFNYDMFNNVVELRTRIPGDKITLTGGTKKLQDYFTDTKIPKSKRDTVPLLADGSNILWVFDENNRINTAYKPKDGQNICWVSVYEKDL